MKKLAAEKSAARDYVQGIGEGFDTYRSLREQGYSKEEAARKSLGKTSLAILSTKADDYLGKTIYKNANLNITNKSGKVITDKQFGKKIGKHTKEYNLNPKNEEDRKEMGRIINDIIDNADEVVEGKWKGQEGPILFYRKGEDLVLIRKNDDNFVSIFKGGANNGWFKNLGR